MIADITLYYAGWIPHLAARDPKPTGCAVPQRDYAEPHKFTRPLDEATRKAIARYAAMKSRRRQPKAT